MKPEFTDDDLRIIFSLARKEIERNAPETVVFPPEQVIARKRQVDAQRLCRKVQLIRAARRAAAFVSY